MSIKEASAFVAENKGDAGFVILDVRTPGEFADGHLEGAINIDVNSGVFDDELMKLDKKKNYLIYCRSGKRSKRAQGIMGEAGFKDTINMTGGFLGWVEEGHPFEK